MKNGTPSIEVIIPTGNSTGGITVLATVSANKSKHAPITVQQGKRNLWSLPIIILAR
jgi:hypothetical protein